MSTEVAVEEGEASVALSVEGNETISSKRKRIATKRLVEDEEESVPKRKVSGLKSPKKTIKNDTDIESITEEFNTGSSSSSVYSGKFTRDQLVSGVKRKQFKRVAFLTGAGISVAAGIPDFRTPKIGLYSQLKDFGLPHPEEIFSLEFLLHNPEPFYAVSNRYLQFKAKPTLAHRFIKHFADQGTLMMDYTQNIDGLELDVGIPSSLLVQAHGHMRSAHCSEQKCKAEADMRLYTRHVRREEVLYCKVCKSGIVKPDIVFFGEKLPKQFNQKFNSINKADLVVIMGTSLKVQPFSTLLATLPTTTPLVVMNYTNPTLKGKVAVERDNMLFLEGDIEVSVSDLMRDIGWDNGQKGKKKRAKAGKK